ncbi:molybdate ABC transporter permease subunit [Thiohalospira sp.]|uniref:molybdate ABC transporter permease subunit n=1 Tax=Thiohalospira sp. TaxID=3080549 RepID=UPI0039805D02
MEVFGIPVDPAPVSITLQLALVTTLILLVAGTPLAWWLARTRRRWRGVVEAVVALPLVLPPTVLGFYLLVALGPNGPVGALWEGLGGERLTFTFTGLVIGSVFYSLPFAVQPLMHAFEQLPRRPLEAATTLGAGPWDRFVSVVLPLSRRGYLVATTLAFAHTVGEFGVVLMIGGNIPGETRVLSIAIYDHVEVLEYGRAHVLSAGLLGFSFLVLLLVYGRGRRPEVAP